MPAEKDAQLFQRQKNMLGLMALNASGILCHLFLAPATSGISSFLKIQFSSQLKNQGFINLYSVTIRNCNRPNR